MVPYYIWPGTDCSWRHHAWLDVETARISLLFAWLALDFKGVIEDINVLFSFRLPDAHAGGIAALIQGLGVLSLLGVAMCGGLWFVLNTFYGPSSALTESMLHFHKFLTVFIEAYFWAHGAMGLIHIFLIVRSQGKIPLTGKAHH
jgi:hypothetical protein